MPVTAANGAVGPVQLIFQGIPDRCIVDDKYMLELTSEVEGWEFTYFGNNWSSETTMRSYIDNVLVP